MINVLLVQMDSFLILANAYFVITLNVVLVREHLILVFRVVILAVRPVIYWEIVLLVKMVIIKMVISVVHAIPPSAKPALVPPIVAHPVKQNNIMIQ